MVFWNTHMSLVLTVYEPRHDKTNKVNVRPAKTQISLSIRPVWSESSLCAQWVAMDPRFLHADSEDSGQIGRMPRLIWVYAGRTLTLLVLSCRGSYNHLSWIHVRHSTTDHYTTVINRTEQKLKHNKFIDKTLTKLLLHKRLSARLYPQLFPH